MRLLKNCRRLVDELAALARGQESAARGSSTRNVDTPVVECMTTRGTAILYSLLLIENTFTSLTDSFANCVREKTVKNELTPQSHSAQSTYQIILLK